MDAQSTFITLCMMFASLLGWVLLGAWLPCSSSHPSILVQSSAQQAFTEPMSGVVEGQCSPEVFSEEERLGLSLMGRTRVSIRTEEAPKTSTSPQFATPIL